MSFAIRMKHWLYLRIELRPADFVKTSKQDSHHGPRHLAARRSVETVLHKGTHNGQGYTSNQHTNYLAVGAVLRGVFSGKA
jgi:hypothetical protein